MHTLLLLFGAFVLLVVLVGAAARVLGRRFEGPVKVMKIALGLCSLLGLNSLLVVQAVKWPTSEHITMAISLALISSILITLLFIKREKRPGM